MAITKKAAERIQSRLKAFQQILETQRSRDVSEADTVTVVKDILSDVFGFDKYAELTSEHAIRGTWCDLALQFDGKVQLLIEVKAIGLALKDNHVKQAIDYAANQGVEWVALTNGIDWILYHVLFKKPIDKEEVVRLSLLEANPRTEDDLERLYLFTREGLSKNALAEYRDRKDATSRFTLAAILLNSDPVQRAIRTEIRRVSEILVDPETISKALRDQVIKREALEGEQADAATRRVLRSRDKSIQRVKDDEPEAPPTEPAVVATAGPKSRPETLP